jgi:RNA polymerase sigma factor (sigma-70 family)
MLGPSSKLRDCALPCGLAWQTLGAQSGRLFKERLRETPRHRSVFSLATGPGSIGLQSLCCVIKEDAEDAVQDGLCKAYTHLRSFQGRSSFSTWLTSIVINSALMTRRRRRAHPEHSLDDILESNSEPSSCRRADAQSDPETVCLERQLNELLDKQLLQLRPSLKVAFRLRAIHGFSLQESSEALGISVSAVKARLFWARRMLARGLQRPLRLGQRHGSSRKGGRPTRDF